MAAHNPDVKRPPPPARGSWLAARRDRCLDWCDRRPRLGWYIAFLSLVNVVLNVLDLLH